MSHSNSQEQTIYRNLAGQIQLGFYENGERFPSAQEIASRFQVSYCPAQRALKALERDGLIKLNRGKTTEVLSKPYEDYLKSPIFAQRAHAILDLIQALKLISSSVSFQGIYNTDFDSCHRQAAKEKGMPVKYLYQLFDDSLLALGNQTILSLYYDIGSFVESGFKDIFEKLYKKNELDAFWDYMTEAYLQSISDCSRQQFSRAKERLCLMENLFYERLETYFHMQIPDRDTADREDFIWEPHKGRIKYCDVIAIDLLRKIDQGLYPVKKLLPNNAVLADIYHVSEITIRRTIKLLNQLGAAKTQNGVGTYVIHTSDPLILQKAKDLMIDDHFKTFLEALQFLAITCEEIIQFTFSYISSESFDKILNAANIQNQHLAVVSTISACLQAIIHHCPIAAIQEIYGKLTLLLLNGSILLFTETGRKAPLTWSELSLLLRKSIRCSDSKIFAAAFYELAWNTFIITKEILTEAGTSRADQVCTPVRLK